MTLGTSLRVREAPDAIFCALGMVRSTMPSFPHTNFLETDAMFLKFSNDLDNLAGGSSSVDDIWPFVTLTPKKRAQSRLLELERYIVTNEWIPMTITSSTEKSVSPHVVCFSQTIDVCVQKTFPVCCLNWANVDREYIEVVKGDLQRFFMFDFNDQTMNRFVEHQMLSTFEEFQSVCHRHFKKYNDPKEARANPLHLLHQMLELQSQPTPEGSQPLSGDEICEMVLGRRSGYSKCLSWGPKPKAHKTTSASSSTTSCL
ncbi:CACTA en-spm transposon protein [Cucumis melo var. makuwa]|uniref:CACTA en-spm transposon protein n=1 Tax=Cucumis melo var. makuwa TaxID=1194695 RepID=A0A5D3E1Z0_CUCMM|nr:CACTA en-spm transposon protein [Cucumis melo var. makuwa]TYK30113.1 CACTA en-spm transposon protein [Cucumis melo var. makuwa]